MEKQIEIEILFDSKEREQIMKIISLDGVSTIIDDHTSIKGFSGVEPTEIINFSVSTFTVLGQGLLCNFLYDILKSKVKKMKINNKVVSEDISETEIRTLIEN